MKLTKRQAEHVKWLKFAISLSQVDLDALTEGQRIDLRDEFQGFLKSMPDHREDFSFNNLKGENAPPSLAAVMADPDPVDEKRAQEILRGELENLGAQVNLLIPEKIEAYFVHGRLGNHFESGLSPVKGTDRVKVLLSHHCSHAGITTEMLRRCATCQKTFLATRKPRPDKKLHCSPRCASGAALKKYRDKKKDLERAKRMHKNGDSIRTILKRLPLKPEDLKKAGIR